MSEDTFTEVTTESWFRRIGGAFKGIVVGVVLFLAAFPILFINEGRAVRRFKTLDEGAGSVVALAQPHVVPDNEGQLVHVSGRAHTDEIVTDPEFAVAVNAIKLQRKVEMYQWKESKKRQTKKKLGGGKKTVTKYAYSKSWSSSLIDSGRFKRPVGHTNPATMPYRSAVFAATEVSLGEFRLSHSLIGKISQTSILPVADLADIEGIDKASFHGDGIYVGHHPSSPQIGDLRITYQIVGPTDVSIVSRQIGHSFEPYRAAAGGTIDMLKTGVFSADSMFQQAHHRNVMWTWLIRLGGFILMLVGIAMIFRPLTAIADVIPIGGSIVGAGTGILSILIAAPLTFLTIAVAWLRYRPLIGMALLVPAVVIAGFIWLRSKRDRSPSSLSPADRPSAPSAPSEGIPSARAAHSQAAPAKHRDSAKIRPGGPGTTPQVAEGRRNPKSTADLFKKGQIFFQTGQYEKAVRQFSRVIKSGADRKSALFNRGVVLFKLNKKEAALKDFKQAANLGHPKARAVLDRMRPGVA